MMTPLYADDEADQITLMPKRVRCAAVSMRADDADKWGHDPLDEREGYQLVFRDSFIKNELLSRLNTFRCNRELCDIALFVREQEIFAHKVVLAAVPPLYLICSQQKTKRRMETRIIVPVEDGQPIERVSIERGTSIAQSTLDYFNRIPHERIEHSIETLIYKTTLLYFEDDFRLTDCADLDDKSSVGSCDIIQDYRRSGKDVAKAVTNGSMDASFNAPIQHRVTGAVPVRLNASRVPNVKYSSTESLKSLDSTDSDPQDIIETRLIAIH
ncbi:unnamed protein product [Cylicocyclus nassatus]|uniref:BTB domain-containing protein n=1 Tax=Cylicocyclus nassatus TaxID=53992 RepID=A0AA36M4M6_CYLNA|nr:unnamed protein product [Cylicocyclus nassatus]